MTLTEFASASGLIFGVAGSVLGVMNFLRDRAKVVVTLQWDMVSTDNPREVSGVIRVTNAGRRSTYISHVALRLPKGYQHHHLLIVGGIAGKKLSEGDPPQIYLVDQSGLEKYADHWRDLVAQVSDTTNKVWISKKLHKRELPTWAKKAAKNYGEV